MGGEAKDEKNFASAIGHKNVKSGGYLQKIADLRRYGFMEKGRFIATSNSKKIIQPLTNEEKQEALNECIMSVNLWRDLYDRLGDEIPSPEDFKIHLAEIGDRDRAYKEGDTIRNLYIDAMKHYDKGVGKVAKRTSFKSDKKIDEEERLFYVAVTRAKDELYIVKQLTGTAKPYYGNSFYMRQKLPDFTDKIPKRLVEYWKIGYTE